MTATLRLLVVEDSEDDALLVVRELERSGHEVTFQRVDTGEAMSWALKNDRLDAVICDHSMPRFNSGAALEVLQESGQDIPFIIVSGTMGEDAAVAAMKSGAHDYILKNSLKRLVPAIEREMAEAAVRRERRKMALDLERSEQRFRLLAEQAQDLIYLYRLKPTAGFEYVSPSALAITGYTPEEHYADPELGFKIVLPEDRHILEDVLNAPQAQIKPVVLRWARKDGTVIWTEQRNVPIYDELGNVVAVEGIARDISERMRAQQEIQDKTRLTQTLLDGFPCVALLLRPGTREIVASNHAGAEVGAVPGKQCFATWGRRNSPCPWCLAPVSWATGQSQHLVVEALGVVWDAHWFPVSDNLYVHYAFDISEQKRNEQQLLESEEKYRTLFEEIKDAVFVSTPAGRLLDMNSAGVELFGYASKEEILNIDLPRDLYFDPAERERFRSALDRQGYVKDFEMHLKRKDGAILLASTTASLARDKEGKPLVYRGIIKDMTEHHRLEEQFFQSQKMESIGRLVGGVAHDFNNILTGIIGFSDLAMAGTTEGHPLWFYLDQIKRQGERAAALTHKLLAFSSRQVLERKNMDLNQAIGDMDKFLRRVIGEQIELKVVAAPELGSVFADPVQVEQVLMNLCVNARDAMREGGLLTIETMKVVLDETYCRSNAWARPGEYAQISVSDTGEGMPPEVMEHLFEPFFTTKERGKGTGLGLATVFGIVKQHGGFINVTSRPGKGTTFYIYFQSVPGPAEVVEPAASQTTLRGCETILVAEDEESVREIVTRVLRGQGYNVLLAGDGDEALKVFGSHRESIKLVILDMVMPKRGGQEVYEELRSGNPGLKCLFVSGYAADGIGQSLPPRETRFLAKPFSPTELARRVRQILDG